MSDGPETKMTSFFSPIRDPKAINTVMIRLFFCDNDVKTAASLFGFES